MGYELKIMSQGNTYSTLLSDSTRQYVSGVSVDVGNNEVGTLTFDAVYNSTVMLKVRTAFFAKNYPVILSHTNGHRSATLFSGYITEYEQDIDGNLHVTCKDDFYEFDNTYMRLADEAADETITSETVLFRAMTKWNKISQRPFTIDSVKILKEYNSYGAAVYDTLSSDGTGNSRLMRATKHLVKGREVMTIMEALKLAAEAAGAVLRMDYTSYNTRNVVLAYASANTEAHVYSRGTNLTKLDVWRGVGGYYNSVFPTGGEYYAREGSIPSTISVKMSSASRGDTDVYVTGATSSTSGTVDKGDYLQIGSQVYYYEIVGPNKIGISPTGITTRLYLDPPIQRDVASGAAAYIRKGITVVKKPTKSTALSNRQLDSGLSVAGNADAEVYTSSVAEGGRLRRQMTYVNTGDVDGGMLAQDAAEQLNDTRYKVEQNLDVGFLEKGIDPNTTYNPNEKSHTIVGEVVHITHSRLSIDVDVRIDGMSISLDSPQSYSYTIGQPKPSMTGKVNDIDRRVNKTSGTR